MLENLYTTKMSGDKKNLQIRFAKIRSAQSRISKLLSLIMLLVIVAAILCATVVMAAIDAHDNERYKIEVTNNSQRMFFESKPFFREGTLYFPLAELLQKSGALSEETSNVLWNGKTVLINISEDVPSAYDGKTNRLNYCWQIEIGQYECILNPSHVLPEDKKHLSIKKEMQHSPLIEHGTVYVPFEYVRFMLNRATQTYYISYRVWDTEYIESTDREADFTNDTIHMDYFDNYKNLYVSPDHALKQFVQPPCENGSISRNFDPANGHDGIDIVASKGTVITAATDGVVTEAGFNAEDGNFVIITGKNTITNHVITAGYSHLDTLDVKSGDRVIQGDTIGLIGNTGMSTGAHLHFEIKIDDTYYNPRILY